MAGKKKKSYPKRTPAEKAAFKRELTEVVPHLRAFARGLCGRPDMADDLVQETLLKACAATAFAATTTKALPSVS